MTRLFFYGTLMASEERGHVLRGLAAPVGPATVSGDLHLVGGGYFPALTSTDGDRRVEGEVWEVFPGCEAEALARTDSIESYRPGDPMSMYFRRPMTARLEDGSEVLVEGYEWNDRMRASLTGRIAGGSWRSYCARRAESYRSDAGLPMEAA